MSASFGRTECGSKTKRGAKAAVFALLAAIACLILTAEVWITARTRPARECHEAVSRLSHAMAATWLLERTREQPQTVHLMSLFSIAGDPQAIAPDRVRVHPLEPLPNYEGIRYYMELSRFVGTHNLLAISLAFEEVSPVGGTSALQQALLRRDLGPLLGKGMISFSIPASRRERLRESPEERDVLRRSLAAYRQQAGLGAIYSKTKTETIPLLK